MKKPTKRRTLFEHLKAGLEEGILFAQGKLKLRTTEIADPPPAMSAKQIASLRRKLGVMPLEFASMINVSVKTVCSWEKGTSVPSHAALRFLQVLAARPEVVCDVVGVRSKVG